MKKVTKTTEWTNAAGVRCITTEEMGDEVMVPVEDMVKLICSFDAASIPDPTRRALVAQFQREAVLLQPAAAHRRAIDLLQLLGAAVPPELERLPLKKLDGA